MEKTFDVIIVGAGPAGIFAAMEICRSTNIKVLLLEKGKAVQNRCCPIGEDAPSCINCKPCSIMSGWGGAGAFSDGKLTLTTEFGGWLHNYMSKDNLEQLITYVDNIYVEFGAPDRVFGQDNEIVQDLQHRVARAGLRLIPARIRHMGTENTLQVLSNMYKHLESQVTIKTGETVQDILAENNQIKGVITNKDTYYAPNIILAPGRDGAHWFTEQAVRLGLTLHNNQVDLGVRVEVPAVTMQEFTDNIWEPKIVYNTRQFDDIVRTFCVNPNGHVVMENTNGIVTVNGHAFAEAHSSNNTNFALLVSQEFTEPFDQPIIYGRCIASLANMLSGSIIVQRFGDLKRGRRSTQSRIERGLVEPTLKGAVPGDLSLVLPHRYLVGICECLEALDQAMPGVASDHTLLYGIEAKFYSARPRLTNGLKTDIDGLWAVGDGAGVTRGLIQASVSGVVAARDLLSN
ncbi:MAG TPA: NAD(P)/FAD-dependent oxidoreductase [Syntrophomonadaceae bacterium]|nr:NAD(P)/FAD-dependent oxidoreductase [Syntrophomonadaceae bacterium]HQA06759.1 NAD(P)/FAD-dependent oxidoreductase [Syntrophomonadaceae bacterium]HQE22608.1 NAD(P)/FAD-dependent oxidoreductase [Syntrophomonadaceae bacterium]